MSAPNPETYQAELWTTVNGKPLWATVNSAGWPVAFGCEKRMREYAGELNANGGCFGRF